MTRGPVATDGPASQRGWLSLTVPRSLHGPSASLRGVTGGRGWVDRLSRRRHLYRSGPACSRYRLHHPRRSSAITVTPIEEAAAPLLEVIALVDGITVVGQKGRQPVARAAQVPASLALATVHRCSRGSAGLSFGLSLHGVLPCQWGCGFQRDIQFTCQPGQAASTTVSSGQQFVFSVFRVQAPKPIQTLPLRSTVQERYAHPTVGLKFAA